MDGGEGLDFEALRRDPYPTYAQLRARCPVRPPDGLPQWLVARWEDVEQVLRDDDVFGPGTDSKTYNLDGSLTTIVGDEHKRVRRLVLAALQARELRETVRARVRETAGRILDEARPRGELELVEEFAQIVSPDAVRSLLGLDALPIEQLIAWNDGLFLGINNFEDRDEHRAASDRARAEIDELLPGVLGGMTADDLPAVLPRLMCEGELTVEEIIANTRIMLIAIREPGHLLALVVRALLSHPEQAAEVAADPRLTRTAVDETMRWSPLVGLTTRETTCPVRLHGVDLPQGAPVAALLASANQDEARWTAPETFDIHRGEGMHRGFGAGIHICPGASIGRTIVAAAVDTLLEQLPGLRLADRSPAYEIDGWTTRTLSRLWVAWDA